MSGIKIGFLQARRATDANWYPTISYGYLKSYITARLGNYADIRRVATLEEMLDCNVLAISSTSQDYAMAQKIATAVKAEKPGIITVIGGHHVTYLPSSMSECFDIGVLGEGEQTFLELVNALVKGSDIGSMPGLCFHHEGKVYVTQPRDLIYPMDLIPIPHRDHWDRIYIMSSRGCPYKCAFCTSSAFWEKTRFFSAKRVVTEIEYILDHMNTHTEINIYDDLFVADRKRLMNIITELEEKKLIGKATYTFSVRANMVDQELCDMIRRMGGAGVCFGAESGSDRILGLMNKKSTVAMNQNALDILSANGIPANCSFIVGWPSETEEEVRQTYAFIVDNIINRKLTTAAAVNILMPMPGTPIWDQSVESGIIPKEGFDWNRLGVFASWQHSTAKSFKDWVDMRRENNSVYMNEHTVPQERLYEIMSEYEQVVMENGENAA